MSPDAKLLRDDIAGITYQLKCDADWCAINIKSQVGEALASNQRKAAVALRAIFDDRDRLIAERDDAIKHSDQVCDSYAAENQRLFDDRDRLRKALEPFANALDGLGSWGDSDDCQVYDYTLTIGDFRRARAALGDAG